MRSLEVHTVKSKKVIHLQMQMTEYEDGLKALELLAKNKSHDTTVLNPELNTTLCINMKLSVLIQATY